MNNPTTNQDLESQILNMPKAEIHVHLEGSMPPETIWKLAIKNNVQLPAESLEEWKSFYEFRDFDHFIEVYQACTRCMNTAEDFQFMVEEFYRYQASQNIVYTEAFISASHQMGKIEWNDFLNALEQGSKIGEERHKVKVRFIPDISREIPETQSDVVDFVIQGFERGLFLGLGLGGPEQGFPAHLFKDSFAKAREAGLHVVAHAGEVCGPESIVDTLDSLKVERIGHGIHCIKDLELMERLKSERIPMEVCPGSNYRTKAVKEGTKHPIHQMMEYGLFCTLNSDDPPMFSTSLLDEYKLLFEQGMSWENLVQLNLNTLEASFLDKAEKMNLRKEVESFARSSFSLENSK